MTKKLKNPNIIQYVISETLRKSQSIQFRLCPMSGDGSQVQNGRYPRGAPVGTSDLLANALIPGGAGGVVAGKYPRGRRA
jgi:hypothetical protein